MTEEELQLRLDDAFELLNSSKLEQSHAAFEKLLDENPRNPNVFFGIGTYYALTEQHYQSRRFLEKAVEIDPENADYYFNLAGVCLKTFKLKAARDLFAKCIELDPSGEHVLQAKKTIGAIQHGISIERRHKQHLTTEQILEWGDLFHDGCDLLEQGDYEEAIVCFKKAVIVDEQSPKAYGNIGMAYCQVGEIEKGRQYLRRSLDLDPDYDAARINLYSLEKHYPDSMTRTLEREFFRKIEKTISGFQYSVEPFLRASRKINVYGNFFELEDFYYHDWEKQDLEKATGLCQHLSCITKAYLSDMTVGTARFKDHYDTYYASGVHESRFFNLKYANHICLVVFQKHDERAEKGWVIDPSLRCVKRCFKKLNCERDIVRSREVFTTNSTHRYLIEAKIGSSIREELQVKENAFIHYGSSFGSYLPLFIYGGKSLVLASLRKAEGEVSVEYYEHKENCDLNNLTHVDKRSRRYRQLHNHSEVFSLIDSLLTKVEIVDESQVGSHKRLVSEELEQDYMMILYYIELAVIDTLRESPRMTDQMVSNTLNDLISRKENKSYKASYSLKDDQNVHTKLKNRMKSYTSKSQCPPRIWINALNQVLGSVRGFIKRDPSDHAYLDFITGYFTPTPTG